jgi:hypothetical protein
MNGMSQDGCRIEKASHARHFAALNEGNHVSNHYWRFKGWRANHNHTMSCIITVIVLLGKP